ncbi:hypothetical protein HanRHA438_Chr02g0055651 [Helianthus annuus]|uniref:Uncharacterized protein n=1 Tax=Helianthus annuus TaxID=4232 RepID=A0A251TNX7_HELAN|nr:hypothetical protein HanXRQr2_Chr02g0054211 [Helianthus annuus]KAJ0603968.1 hypothetical protein HanHA300_Chr02g0044291 [Helianthus annuus]KAJ0617977.1 hypothetical protein HanHA89_Chr02g0047921 [Helianthus annuus]KAJ0776463.1 hypothetical protein HanLR1_Chr02g0045941 [Helianthus annuus]KAJ0938958.1 hypothetical protein HanRHA438_Chr02g0055651 [Helianthus annuus]
MSVILSLDLYIYKEHTYTNYQIPSRSSHLQPSGGAPAQLRPSLVTHTPHDTSDTPGHRCNPGESKQNRRTRR